jgi:hypothetical protein
MTGNSHIHIQLVTIKINLIIAVISVKCLFIFSKMVNKLNYNFLFIQFWYNFLLLIEKYHYIRFFYETFNDHNLSTF